MIDENAFGILVAHYDLESTEYSLSESAFLEYLARFAATLDRQLREHPLCDDVRRVDFGHALYLEFADGDQRVDPITWLRNTRQALVDADLPNICVLTAGGRWGSAAADETSGESPGPDDLEDAPESGSWRVSTLPAEDSNALASPMPLVRESTTDGAARTHGPSEPLRKALAAEAFAQPTTSEDANTGWGPGLYIEKDAIEQLGKNLRNTPTALPALSAVFYRIGV